MAQQAKKGASRGSGGTKRSSSSARTQKTKAARQKELEQTRHKRQSVSIVLFAVSVLLLLLILFPKISVDANDIIHGLFGRSCGFWCAALFYVSVILAKESPENKLSPKLSKAALLTVFISSFIHAVTPSVADISDMQMNDAINELYAMGIVKEGAGAVGGAVGALLISIFGRVLSIVLIVLAAFVIIMLATGTSLSKLFQIVSGPVRAVSENAGAHAAEREEQLVRRAERAGQRAGQRAADREQRQRIREAERERVLRERLAQSEYEEEEYEEYEEAEPAPAPSRRRRARFNVDVPLSETADEAAAEETEEGSSDSVADAISAVLSSVRRSVAESEESAPAKRRRSAKAAAKAEEKPADEEAPAEEPELDNEEFEQLLEKVAGQSKRQRAEEIARQAAGFAHEVNSADEQPAAEYHYPQPSLLIPPDISDDEDIRSELKENSERLVAVLKEYGVAADIVDICRGPAVTRYELCPAPGVKISKITSLTDDIALRLAATAVRIEAPIPGKSAVGVEIPNDKSSIVRISELIDTPAFRDAKSPVTVAIGKDIDGHVILTDLSDMPHLLVAGSTGTGKSVCINSMLISLIYKSSPEDVRLIMVDPKKVELDVYNGIPQLLVPVVTDPKRAAGALQWAVGEMEKRYTMLLEQGVRGIKNYNKKAEETGEFPKLPRIIIIIDELADLMSNSPKEVEASIATLAAKARAAGIHMVLATQRPSVDVITGTIKNNIPSRIAFKVTSQVDSRTILDERGAEGLIGRGDMLFMPSGKKPLRVQGSFVDDSEVEEVVGFIKSSAPANYDEDIAREIERRATAGDEAAMGDDEGLVAASDDDPLFIKAAEVVIEAGQASVSLLQRRLTIGYARAGRIVDQLERAGVVGPYEGSKPRSVIMTRQDLIEMTMARNTAPVKPAPPQAAYTPQNTRQTTVPEWDDPSEVPFDLDPPFDTDDAGTEPAAAPRVTSMPQVVQTAQPAPSPTLGDSLARAAQLAEQMRMEKDPDDADVPLPPHIEQLQQSAVKITVMPSPFGGRRPGDDDDGGNGGR